MLKYWLNKYIPLFIIITIAFLILYASYWSYLHTSQATTASVAVMSYSPKGTTLSFTDWLSYLFNAASTSIALFGLVFIFLKYQLDQNKYHKDLFEKRYKIFLEVDKILSLCFQDRDDEDMELSSQQLISRLDTIWRRGYFLFGKKTYNFLWEFRKAVLDKNFGVSPDQTERAATLLGLLLEKQALSEKFPELKIDNYGLKNII